MSDLAIRNETMTSLEISEVTGKRHSDVLEAIRNMEPAWRKIAQRKFPLGSYKDANNQERPCYYLSKTECLYVATKFNDEARAKLVLRWEELEKKEQGRFAIPSSFSEALMLAAKQAEQIEAQQKQLAAAETANKQLTCKVNEMKDKVSYLDQILSNKSTVVITQIAQDYGMSAIAFNKLLERLKIQHKMGSQWILYAQFLENGYVHSKTIEIPTGGTTLVKMHTEWTQKGRIFLYDQLKQNGIVPLIERN